MPQFNPEEERVAIATFPTKPAGLPCAAELWLASDMTKVATSDRIPFTATGGDQSITLPITLPSVEGTYPVYLEVFSNGQRIAVFRSDEDVVIISALAGEISHIWMWYEPLEQWGRVWGKPGMPAPSVGPEIPLNGEIYIAPVVVNRSEISIVLHADLEVTYPDGTKRTLTATENQDREWAPDGGAAVIFEPFIASQEGNYTVVATLSSGGQVLDSVTFTLVTAAIEYEYVWRLVICPGCSQKYEYETKTPNGYHSVTCPYCGHTIQNMAAATGNVRAIVPLSYGPLDVAIVSYPPAPAWKVPVVHCNVTNPTGSKLSATIKLKLYESYYYPGYGLVEAWKESPGQVFEIPAGGSIDYVYDGTEITSPILIESGGGYIVISWQLWLEDNFGGMSEVYEFTT